jgi:mannose/fructose/N-acetylgalactosamine-specific phosphotransferase system component IIB
MPLVLVRIDDRLIHGQVTVAWGSWLEPDRIILVNDDVASTEWKRSLYASTDTLGSAVSILTKDEFVTGIETDEWDAERVVVVVESPSDMLELMKRGLAVPSVNVGGMHFTCGKREILPYVFVDDDDVRAMRDILKLGATLEARDVPQSRSVDLSCLL